MGSRFLEPPVQDGSVVDGEVDGKDLTVGHPGRGQVVRQTPFAEAPGIRVLEETSWVWVRHSYRDTMNLLLERLEQQVLFGRSGQYMCQRHPNEEEPPPDFDTGSMTALGSVQW